jgi:hypothetical protein
VPIVGTSPTSSSAPKVTVTVSAGTLRREAIDATMAASTSAWRVGLLRAAHEGEMGKGSAVGQGPGGVTDVAGECVQCG